MAGTEDLSGTIGAQPFFDGIDAELRDLLAGCAAPMDFADGDALIRTGVIARAFYLIRAGEVEVTVEPPAGPPIVLETLVPGDVVGWSWLVPPHRGAFTARAKGEVEALAFDGACLLGKMEAHPALGFEMLRRFVPVMAHRLSAARLQLLDLYGPDAPRPEMPEAEPEEPPPMPAAAGVRAEAEAAKASLAIVKNRAEDEP